MDILEQAKQKLKEQNQQSSKPKKKKSQKKTRITQDKKMDKDEIVIWLNNYITENKFILTLDFLRSQKLILEALVEMRK